MTAPNIIMYDATSAAQIPLDPAKLPANVAVAGYCDGDFAASWRGMCARFPTLSAQQRVLSIATKITSIARIMDVEPGNPTKPVQIPGWIEDMIAHGVYKPGAYADEADMPVIVKALTASSLKRDQYVLWLANPTSTIHFDVGYDITQSPFDGNFDVNDCLATVFPPLVVPKPVPTKHPARAKGIAKFSGEVDLTDGKWSVKGEPGKLLTGTDVLEWTAKIAVGNSDGKWSIDPLPFNS